MRYSIKNKDNGYTSNVYFESDKEAKNYVKYFYDPLFIKICQESLNKDTKILWYVPRSKHV